MPATSAIEALMRRQLLEKIYDRMTDEEKRTFVLLTMQNRSTQEIMQALQQQHAQINRMADKIEKQNWYTDFGSDVAANLFTDGLIWLARRLFRR
jgi:hypothetical protein